MIRRHFLPALFFLVLACLFTARACGPDFFPDVFVHPMHPDKAAEYAAGQLGVLLPTYPRADLIVAFRYLSGGTLAPNERAAYDPTYTTVDPEWGQSFNRDAGQQQDAADPAEQWKAARATYAAPAPKVQQDRPFAEMGPGRYIYDAYYQNCQADAFRTALLTLQSRAKTWGEKSPDLADWLKAQDAVFSNCAGKDPVLPAPAPANSPVLLKADRAYQAAPAQF